MTNSDAFKKDDKLNTSGCQVQDLNTLIRQEFEEWFRATTQNCEMIQTFMFRAWQAAYNRSRDDMFAPTSADYEEVLADHRRLVRELDVAMNGEEGAAKQASLCDIVDQVKAMSRTPSPPDVEGLVRKLEAIKYLGSWRDLTSWQRSQNARVSQCITIIRNHFKGAGSE